MPSNSKVYSKQYYEANRSKLLQYRRQYLIRNVEHQEAYNRQRRVECPEKVRARGAVSNAVQRGKLIKPNVCQNCNQQFSKRLIHAHHDDYSKPLEIRWLCPACHKQADTECHNC